MRLLTALRKMLSVAPQDPNARAWHVADDGLAEFRTERRWSDLDHRWETRLIWFSDAEAAQRNEDGRLSQADRSL